LPSDRSFTDDPKAVYETSYPFLFFDLDSPENVRAKRKIFAASINTFTIPNWKDRVRNVEFYDEPGTMLMSETEFQEFLNEGKTGNGPSD
jgi:hypothetical protein